MIPLQRSLLSRPREAWWVHHLVSSLSTQVKPQFLPVQDFIPALHIKPEVRKGNWDGIVFPSNEVPGSVISHFLPFLSVLPAPFTLLIPEELGQSGQGTLEESHWGAGLPSVRPCLHCLHIGFGEVKGPVHSSWLQSRHSLTFNGDIQPEKRTGRHQGQGSHQELLFLL